MKTEPEIGREASGKAAVPLVLDVDGTLLKTDMLHETFWRALGTDLLATLRTVFAFWRQPQRMKRRLLGIAVPETELMPERPEMVALAVSASASGRSVHLASGSDRILVESVASRFGMAGTHFGSDETRNLTRAVKASVLEQNFGRQGYDYAGNSWDDLESWEVSREVIAVTSDRRLLARLNRLGKPVEVVPDEWSPRSLLHEMRPHQWLKNLLLFLPLLVAGDMGWAQVLAVAVAALAFSLGASSIYFVNDLLDLDSDRRHPTKRTRPIASGDLPIRTAMLGSIGLAFLAIGLALTVSGTVAALILTYMAGSLVYSLWLKKLRWVDLATLAMLFQLRVLTGAAAAGVAVSGWLLGFVFAVFFVLACVKRLTALARVFRGGHLPGRGYSQRDLAHIRRAAEAGIAVSVALFLAYCFSPSAAVVFSTPEILALAAVPVAVWLFRVVRLAAAGREDYDPVVFVTHDRVGLLLAAVGVAIGVIAA